MTKSIRAPANDDGEKVYNLGGQFEATPVYIVGQYDAKGSGGGGGGGDAAWKSSVESRLNNLHHDLSNLRSDLISRTDRIDDKIDTQTKWLLSLLCAATLGLAGLMATGFGWVGGDERSSVADSVQKPNDNTVKIEP